MDYISLGRRVNKRRRELHLTQEELAEKLGLSTSFVGHIERGSRKASLETVVALCNTLDVSPTYLLEHSLTITSPEAPLFPTPLSAVERRRLRQVVETFSHWLSDSDDLAQAETEIDDTPKLSPEDITYF